MTNEEFCGHFNDTWEETDELKKIGDSVKSYKVWYKIIITGDIKDFNTGTDSIVLDNISIVYYDVDNKTISAVDENNSIQNIHFKDCTSVSITKYRQTTETILIGFETATVDQLSNPDFKAKGITETVVHEPETVVFCPMVNDKDGYRVLRNTR
jgi:hypothetical protein